MARYLAYRRVSSDDQVASGLGMEAQLDSIRKAIGKEPDEIFCDEGISGKRADRPGLLAALESLKKGDVLIVAKRDRLARDVFLSCWIEKEVKKRGARIMSAAGEGTDGDDPTAVLLRRVVDAFSEYERLIIGQRTKAALARKKARGEKTGGETPYGYSVDSEGRLYKNREEIQMIFIMKTLRADGKTLKAIAEHLNKQNLFTRKGTPWHPVYVGNILRVWSD